MREINLSDLPQKIVSEILEKTPSSEDISVIDAEGNIVSIIIKYNTYQYLLKKIEEDEESIDYEELKEFYSKKEKDQAIDFDDFIKGE